MVNILITLPVNHPSCSRTNHATNHGGSGNNPDNARKTYTCRWKNGEKSKGDQSNADETGCSSGYGEAIMHAARLFGIGVALNFGD